MSKTIEAVKGRIKETGPTVPAELTPAKVTRQTMLIADWAEVPDCIMQRDTKTRAKTAIGYLNKPLLPHYEVSAASFRGDLIKLDGHTRSLLWASGKIPRIQEHVNVNVYHVDALDELRDLYEAFDSRRASKTAKDTTESACKTHGLSLSSQALRGYRFGLALNTATLLRASERYEQVALVRDELEMLDEIDPKQGVMWNPHFAAALVTMKLHGEKAKQFWYRLNHNDHHPADYIHNALGLTKDAKGCTGQFASYKQFVHQLIWLCDRWVKNPGDIHIGSIPSMTVIEAWEEIRAKEKSV